MRFKITIGVTALALVAAFASVPAFAGQGISGYSPNGKVVAIHRHQARTRSLFDVVPQHKQAVAPYYGRNVNDGGMVQ